MAFGGDLAQLPNEKQHVIHGVTRKWHEQDFPVVLGDLVDRPCSKFSAAGIHLSDRDREQSGLTHSLPIVVGCATAGARRIVSRVDGWVIPSRRSSPHSL
jgi:hypothetical protein